MRAIREHFSQEVLDLAIFGTFRPVQKPVEPSTSEMLKLDPTFIEIISFGTQCLYNTSNYPNWKN